MFFDLVCEFLFIVWSYKKGEMVLLMIYFGDCLGIYCLLQGVGFVIVVELVECIGFKECWLFEWLCGQVVVQFLDYKGDDCFELNEIQVQVLVDEENFIFFVGGVFGELICFDVVVGFVDVFQMGIGFLYDQFGLICVYCMECMFGLWMWKVFVLQIILVFDGVVDKLKSGIKVVDVGCGVGVVFFVMVEVFLVMEFYGYDFLCYVIECVREMVIKMGFENVVLKEVVGEDLLDDCLFDFVIIFDCIYDMMRLDKVIDKIYGVLKEDGIWFIKDICSKLIFEENLCNLMFVFFYGFLVFLCMFLVLLMEDGMGFGMVGFNFEVVEWMM